MYDSKRIKAEKDIPITLDYILSKVDEYTIYAKYLGEIKIGHIYNSPFRTDNNPSFGIFRSKKTGQLLFKDYGSNECGNVIKFVSLYTGLTNYNDILKRIIEDLRITNTTKLKSIRASKYTPTETVIGVVRQDFTETDINYWQQFNIDIDTLNKFGVSSIKYYLCNGIVKGIYKENNPMYCYKVYNHFKIYRPLASKYTKWRNNLTELDIQGYKQLPNKGKLLIITKSLKDVMCLYKMGYSAISPSSESTFIPEKVLNVLFRRFKTILLCYDRDAPGIKNMRKISLKTGLKGILVNKRFNSKDISDAIKLNGFNTVKAWIDKTLEKYI